MKIHYKLRFIITVGLFLSTLYANDFPQKPIELIVGFGEGGSTDRMTRIMQPFLEEIVAQKLTVTNIRGKGTQSSIEYFLKKPQDGYTMLSSTFSPYMQNAIISGKAQYKIEDFDFINLQWFDYDLIAVHQESKIDTLLNLLETMQKSRTPLKVALIYRSAGHLNLNLLLEKFGIERKKLIYVFFESGQKAREALVKKEVDFLIISAQGSETIREHINPLAVVKDTRAKKWDAPTLNEAIATSGISLPILRGSMRGFAVSKAFKKKYPERYDYLVEALKKTLAQKRVQRALKLNHIGYAWVGPEHSNALMKESFEIFKAYDHLFDAQK
ncbi:MAG: tripartite tricarboxylate transporter substrate-binding protein [Sulfurospirillaceae bacterium]|nr:tripartite tricarboxylate transporter substrate-binding protein [Sulfurospirillaceae bacterium]MDD2827868.1 tripartite tricarboxylate transporter substrate-binding protein [Sulfurospirillaceae bacterium]